MGIYLDLLGTLEHYLLLYYLTTYYYYTYYYYTTFQSAFHQCSKFQLLESLNGLISEHQVLYAMPRDEHDVDIAD